MGTVLIVSMLFAIVVVLGIARRIGRRMIGVES
jgi:hypothetical protein